MAEVVGTELQTLLPTTLEEENNSAPAILLTADTIELETSSTNSVTEQPEQRIEEAPETTTTTEQPERTLLVTLITQQDILDCISKLVIPPKLIDKEAREEFARQSKDIEAKRKIISSKPTSSGSSGGEHSSNIVIKTEQPSTSNKDKASKPRSKSLSKPKPQPKAVILKKKASRSVSPKVKLLKRLKRSASKYSNYSEHEEEAEEDDETNEGTKVEGPKWKIRGRKAKAQLMESQVECMDIEDDDAEDIPMPVLYPVNDVTQNERTIKKKSKSKGSGAWKPAGTAAIPNPSAGLLVLPPPPKLICGHPFNEKPADSSDLCKKEVNATSGFPCHRCQRVFYCSKAHQEEQFEGHQAFCKTPSSLEIINIDPQYTTWHKHAASNLYDICTNFVLVWPSLTAQWLPGLTELDDNINRHQLLLGTQTTGEPNHLLICGVDLPERFDTENDESNVSQKHTGSLYVMQRINHEGEVHRARYMPQKNSMVATKSPSNDVFLFDCASFPEIPEDTVFKPTLRLRGHNKDGFGLAWNPNIHGRLCSGSSDGLVCLWDIHGTPELDSSTGDSFINPLMCLEKHTDVVEDVAWHHESNNIFASVGDDKKMILWDIRLDGARSLIHLGENAHKGDINAVSFSCFSEYYFATGGSDKVVAIWDMRRMDRKLHSLEFHKDDVMQVQWSPHDALTLASTGKDRRVLLWNLAALDKKQPKTRRPLNSNEYLDEIMDPEGPVALEFIHGGHVAAVNDISWNHQEDGMIASVSEDNVLQVWKMDDALQI